MGNIFANTMPQDNEYAIATNLFYAIVNKEEAIQYYKDFPYNNNIRLYQCTVPQDTKYLYGRYTYYRTINGKANGNEIQTLAVKEIILTKDITNEI